MWRKGRDVSSLRRAAGMEPPGGVGRSFGNPGRHMPQPFAMPSRVLWKALRLSRRVWVRVTLIAVLAVVAAGLAPLLQGVIPEQLADRLGEESTRPILNVLATSMLAVTTFSLSVMVAAHRAASEQVTPRTHRLLLEDTTTQTVLATFLGAFIYALTSIVLINASLFTARSVTVSFFFTVFVILLVVIAILRWIDHLSRLGSMLETTRTVERAAEAAFGARLDDPFLGCRPAAEAPAGLAHRVGPETTSYVGHVDTQALVALAREAGFDIVLRARPGDFVSERDALAETGRSGHDDAIRAAFTLADARDFTQDPRFGLIVLSEIASRALSPGINDPGTAIDVIGRVLRLLLRWRQPEAGPRTGQLAGPDGDRRQGEVFVAPLDPADLVEDGFLGAARDGAGMVEVQLALQKALAALAASADPAMAAAARAMSARARDYAAAAMPLAADLARVEAAIPGAAGP